jgi:hypothetical protein
MNSGSIAGLLRPNPQSYQCGWGGTIGALEVGNETLRTGIEGAAVVPVVEIFHADIYIVDRKYLLVTMCGYHCEG